MYPKKDVLYGSIGLILFGHALLEVFESLISHDFTFLEVILGGIFFLILAVKNSKKDEL